MSMLLDAVQRQRANQQPHDPAVAAMLPSTQAKQPWHSKVAWPWLAPPLALVVSAAAGWLLAQQQPQQVVAVQVTHPKVVDKATSTELGQRISLPLPVSRPTAAQTRTNPVISPAPESSATVTSTPTRAAVTDSTQDAAITETAQPVVTAAKPEQTEQIGDPQLLAALEQALADVGGVAEETPEEPAEQPLFEVIEPVEQEPEQEAQPELAQGQYQQAEESLDGLTEEQQYALEQALAKAGMAPMPETKPEPESIPKLGQLPWAFQKRLPDLEVTAHVYASEADKRWLRANGRELQEGDEAAPGLTVKEILPSEIILEMDNQAFRIPALGSI